MDKDVGEGDIVHVEQAHHDHAGDPEGNDFAGGAEDAAGIVGFE